MAEETQVLTLQQRIAALKQAQGAQSPDAAASPFLSSSTPTPLASRPATARPRPVDDPPPYTHSASSTNGNGKNHDEVVKPPSRVVPPRPPSKPRAPPPPLPARAPALPPRRPSEISRKNSFESVASDASRSTSTSAGRTAGSSLSSTGSGATFGIRAPAWGETELPALPPKRDTTKTSSKSSTLDGDKSIKPPPRPKSSSTISSRSLPATRPPLPTRRESSTSTVSNGNTRTPSRPPPPLPSRSNTDGPVEKPATAPRKLPPPPPSSTALDKLHQSGFASIKSITNTNTEPSLPPTANGTHPETNPAGTPPPVPLSSRPDLSKLQATKPRMPVASSPTPTVACLKCRDFSAPDAHAAQYPRGSLPTHDLGWLARELTAPFPSATDKARAIFTWLHHNIEYDVKAFFGNNVQPSTPGSTFSTGLAVCEGYARLFETLGKHAGLDARVVGGHGKGFGYNAPAPGSPIPPRDPSGHAWNVVRIDNGQWKLLDPCWGAGSVCGAGQPYQKHFNPAMFTDTNDEFGTRHFPSDRSQFYRDDGRAEISWEEYIIGNPATGLGIEQPQRYSDADKHSIGVGSLRPAAKQICVSSTASSGPVRFQFGLVCPHWTLEHHARAKPGLFLLMVHGVDGRRDERLPLTMVTGSGPGGGGAWWYVDVPSTAMLGAPGQTVQLAVLTKFGDRQDARGVTAEEYRRQAGRVGMSWAYIAQWELV